MTNCLNCANNILLKEYEENIFNLKAKIKNLNKIKNCLLSLIKKKDDMNLSLKNNNIQLKQELMELKSIYLKKNISNIDNLNIHLNQNTKNGINKQTDFIKIKEILPILL